MRLGDITPDEKRVFLKYLETGLFPVVFRDRTFRDEKELRAFYLEFPESDRCRIKTGISCWVSCPEYSHLAELLELEQKKLRSNLIKGAAAGLSLGVAWAAVTSAYAEDTEISSTAFSTLTSAIVGMAVGTMSGIFYTYRNTTFMRNQRDWNTESIIDPIRERCRRLDVP